MADGPFSPITPADLFRLESTRQSKSDIAAQAINDLSKTIQTSLQLAAEKKIKDKELKTAAAKGGLEVLMQIGASDEAVRTMLGQIGLDTNQLGTGSLAVPPKGQTKLTPEERKIYPSIFQGREAPENLPDAGYKAFAETAYKAPEQPKGAELMTEYATRQAYKAFGLSDASIKNGIEDGTYPKQLPHKDVERLTALRDKLGGGAGGKTPTSQELRKEFTAHPQVKQFNEITQSYQRVLDSSREPSAAGDLALIFNYMKILDPGSVVREGEFANAQNAAGVPERIRAQYNKVISGERLSDVTRDDFVDRAGKLYEGQDTLFQSLQAQFKKIAETEGLDPSQALLEIPKPKRPSKKQKNIYTPGQKIYIPKLGEVEILEIVEE